LLDEQPGLIGPAARHIDDVEPAQRHKVRLSGTRQTLQKIRRPHHGAPVRAAPDDDHLASFGRGLEAPGLDHGAQGVDIARHVEPGRISQLAAHKPP